MAIIKIKRGLQAELPKLDDGELAMTTDTSRLFIGNNGNDIELASVTEVEKFVKRFEVENKRINDKLDEYKKLIDEILKILTITNQI